MLPFAHASFNCKLSILTKKVIAFCVLPSLNAFLLILFDLRVVATFSWIKRQLLTPRWSSFIATFRAVRAIEWVFDLTILFFKLYSETLRQSDLLSTFLFPSSVMMVVLAFPLRSECVPSVIFHTPLFVLSNVDEANWAWFVWYWFQSQRIRLYLHLV